MAAGDVSIRFAAEGDATLKSAVQAIDAQMKALNEQLKASTEGMKDLSTQEDASAKRTEALNSIVAASQEKLKILGDQYDSAKEKLDQLAEAMRKAQESGDPAAIDKATTAYNRQSAEVSKLEGAMAKTEGEISKANNAMNGAEKKSDSLKDKLGQLASTMSIQLAQDAIGKVVDGLEKIGKAAIDAGKALWDAASDASVFADDLITQSTETGISTQALQEYAYAARFVDTEVSTITGSLVKLTKNMSGGGSSVTAAFEKLGVQTTDANGKLRDSQEVFWECIEALGNVKDATERDSTAMTLFGKSAQQLNPLISAGRDEWNRYAQEAHDAGLILSDDAVGALGSFNDGLQRIDATMDAAQRQIMGALAPAFETVATMVADAAQEFTRWVKTDEAQAYLKELTDVLTRLAQAFLSNLQPAVQTAIEIFKKVSSAIEFLSENFDAVVAAIKSAVVIWGTLKAAMVGLQIAALVTNPIGAAVAAIAALVAAIGVLVANWDKVKEAGKKAWEAIKSAWNSAGEWFKSIGTKIADAFTSIPTKIGQFFSNAWQTVQNAWQSAAQWFNQIGSNVVNAFTSVPGKIQSFFSNAWNNAKDAWSGAVSNFQSVGSNVVNAFNNVPGKIQSFFSSAWSNAKNAWSSASSNFQSVGSNVANAFNSIPSKIQSFFSNAWNSAKNAWNGAQSTFSQIGQRIVSAISSAISGLGSKATQWAKDMMDGFGQGITRFMDKVTQPVRNLASKISSFLHFSRPDVGPLRDYEKWMPDFVSGLASTMEKSQPVLDHAAAALAGGIADGVKGITLSASQARAAQAQPVYLQVDGKTFARLMTPYIDTQQGQSWGTRMALGVG